jgi:NAD(P)-dependent dehydrogenase (short-subunit alcohol dehydrogenase family)
LIGKNNNITGVQGEVSNLTDIDRLYAKVKEQKGRIDILFANASIALTSWINASVMLLLLERNSN